MKAKNGNVKKVKAKKMDIVTKMALIGIIGLISILVIFSVIFFKLSNKKDENNEETQNVSQEEEKEEVKLKEYIRAIALVKEVNLESNELKILDIEKMNYVTLKVDGAVDIKDEYGTILSFAQLDVGDLIETKYEKDTLIPEHIKITALVWERKNVQNMNIDTINKTIQIANDFYNYTDDLVVTYNGELYNLLDIDPVDKVTVKGYKDTIWSIELQSRHGKIVLKNYNKFIGGIIEIGKMTMEIKPNMEITVPVGVHNVELSKEGMAPFVTQALVIENEEFIIDVSSASTQTGMVQFKISQPGAKLYIDNKEITDYSEPISLDFNEYILRVEKEGYETQERKLIVNQEFMTVEVNIEEKQNYIYVDSPVGCSLFIDANYIGIIPVKAPISSGNHTLTIRKDGYYSKMYSIQIEPNGEDSYFTFPELIKITTDDDNNEDEDNSNQGPINTIPGTDVYNN